MIHRYSLSAPPEAVASRLGVDPTEAYSPQFNAAPTHLLPVVTQESPTGLSFFYWGAPPAWANQKPLGERLINVLAEGISEKPALRKKLRTHRCLVPADGFFIWKRIGKKASVPYRFTLPDKSIFGMAGLWEEYEDEKDVNHHTFSLVTTSAPESMVEFSDRMPVILAPEQGQIWLGTTDEAILLSVLGPYPGVLDHYSVSSLVNNPTVNDRRIIQAVPPADQFGNLTLFD
ncbi:MAG: SOS response-associated peptidase [Cyclobacteriaceae bacterium]|nr:SOS response-associated peptidase [Cyclobacteriaceae bacterium]